ncbi:MAG: bifunctional 5,10-methylene-tetrahydrofolate dehydrogenase/5,10-methylene-tetrahydrofolate cyclohydrolase [Gammaproteobacteria bacterium]|jgi:methylenetetrahydrofolate dehydrogenase (NADP+)/methenyltetrahydrofolate cyclohydrolase|nr:bifunctional 5,10-methylene-tetrahydrofolate dehydrogenase/5,10-methylene-tetrahydrofolate cyclohydrolase [Gammaproteobacteria bacterium]MDG1247886.1 tetrahydrofolate dehydrogenase/cyclohydrolase catalytic domain-containing protein [SAR86 cluster bacterium]MDG1948717.1 tetrahydrofolate dehydrogenase/cyclohydrolase catalytic domain-containing protein [SAR86 cluster bacterium]MDG2092398.1 tetrahydrofolate dehydrogenase/cyclohydrolase catalytic domain-containing protein [SAR86 cluster bacterium]|tara:strand:- start:2353 stop:3195 length:843 start_codon:yes stop_codon:yes gene_type:complete
MSAILLDGKKLASDSEVDIKKQVQNLIGKGVFPTLATILVGNDPASETYVKMKRNTCARVGMKSIAVELEDNITTEELINQIDILNRDKNIHGILLQHPVPSHIDERACFDKISLEKDVDGVTCLGFGNMAMGLDAYGSCTPAGIIRLIDSYNLDVEGLNAVVVGRSPILGKPMAMMLLNKNATVTICHSRTRNIESIISEADLIVGAVGIPKFIQKNWIKNDCIVIDAGYHPDKCGDIDLDGVEEIASAFTPVPGGVGPMTINTLILQTLQSAIKATKV